MNDELPELFANVTPPPAPAGLRRQVLKSVERELARRSKSRWERRFELAAAACLLLGVGLTTWQTLTDSAWQRVVRRPADSPAAGSAFAARHALGDKKLTDFINRRLASRPPEPNERAA